MANKWTSQEACKLRPRDKFENRRRISSSEGARPDAHENEWIQTIEENANYAIRWGTDVALCTLATSILDEQKEAFHERHSCRCIPLGSNLGREQQRRR